MAHTLLQLIKQAVQMAAPGMALLGEAIVSPEEIIKYFGTGDRKAMECDFAYNATQMALQWDALATGDTRVMLAAQHIIIIAHSNIIMTTGICDPGCTKRLL